MRNEYTPSKNLASIAVNKSLTPSPKTFDMEQPITFKNYVNQTLFGILHTPESGNKSGKRIGINLLNPGLKNRVAPNRLNIKIARMLCQEGFHVLRFDPHGIGDSEGTVPNESVLDLWGAIHKEEFVEDTLSANEYFLNTCSLEELALIGGCGGAITAFFAAVKDDRVRRLVLIDMPVIVSNSNRSYKDRIISSEETSRQALRGYLFNALTRPRSWINLLTGKSEYSAIWVLLSRKLRIRKHDHQHETFDDINFNRSIPLGLEKLISRSVEMSFVLAEMDTNTQIFRDRFQGPYLSNNSEVTKLTDVFAIKNANHIYALKESQEALLDYILNSLTDK